MATSGRELYVYKAMLAEDAERYEEMMEFMNKALDSINFDDGGELSTEERNLLAIAYKNVIGTRRSALRVITTIEQKEVNRGNAARLEIVRAYKVKIEKELTEVCHNILKAVDTKLLICTDSASALKSESKVFYLKMKGDYNRYLAEFKDGDEKRDAADTTLSAYEAAQEMAQAELPSTHPIRLGLALNFAVFYYEILNLPDRACNLAKQAFDEAIPELDGLGEEAYRESTLIMQLLRDNLTLWTSDLKDFTSDEIPEAAKAEVPKVEAAKAEAAKAEAPKADDE